MADLLLRDWNAPSGADVELERMSVPVREFLKNRRDRALGTILGNAERDIWPKLSQAERDGFRRVVLDALNGYHDAVLDLVKAEDGTRNEAVIQILERIDRRTAQSVERAKS